MKAHYIMTKQEIIKEYGRDLERVGVNVFCVTKQELLRIINFRCRHKHDFRSHPNCYRESKDNLIEKIAVLDIETSNLDANFGIILSWCIKPLSEKIIENNITFEDIKKGTKDRRLTKILIDELCKYNRIVTHYGTYFDIGFIRTRALKHGFDFPDYGQIWHTDVWKIAKRKLKLNSNRQGTVAEAILGENIKTRIHSESWLDMQFGNIQQQKDAIAYIVDHNRKDVIQLERNYLKLRRFVREGKNSI